MLASQSSLTHHRRLLPLALIALTLLSMIAGIRPALAAGAANPQSTVNVPPDVFIGEPLTFTVTFDNTGLAPDDTGYGPFIDLYLPAIGTDGAGAATDDGITFISATYLGAPVNAVVQTFPASGVLTHPYARLNTGAYATVNGNPGDQLVVLQLPFGSFTTGQPPVNITVNTALSDLADLNTPLTIRTRSGFQFGNNPLDNWCCDPVIINPALPGSQNATTWPGIAVTPQLLTLTKRYIGPEDETATGPNFPRRYVIDVDIANGQTVSNLDVTDLLPPTMAFLRVVSSSPAGAIVLQTPTVDAAANAPNNDLVVRFPSVTGGSGSSDASVVLEYYVPQLDANATPVLDPATGDDVTAENEARAQASWTPIDTRDPATPVTVDKPGPEHTLTEKSIAIQKGQSIQNDVGAAGYTPGDVIEYSIDFQVSDFFAFDQVSIDDTFSDGQRLDTSFVPTLEVNGHSFTLPAASFNNTNYTVAQNFTGAQAGVPAFPTPPFTLDPAGDDGTTQITFRVSDELISRGQPDGRLIGACVPPTGTAAAPPFCTDSTVTTVDDGPTGGRIIFRTIVQETFSNDFPSGDASVDQGDALDNTAIIQGRVLSTTDATTPTGNTEDDDTSTEFEIVRGALNKSIYAINGNTSFTTPVEVAPRDTVTYRLELTLPASDIEDLTLTDYLPLPIFNATEISSFDNTPNAAAPPAGTVRLGPSDTFHTLFPGTPTLTTSGPSADNTVTLLYGDYDDTSNTTTKIDILFTVTVSDAPFADRLFLTNQVRQSENSTNQGSVNKDAIVQITLTEPILRLSKGVVSTSSTAGTVSFSPASVGPTGITFDMAGANLAAPRNFSGTINSTGLLANQINSNLGGVDAGDLVKFAIMIENRGTSRNGAFDVAITDTIPLGMSIPPGGMNLKVSNGVGTSISYSGLGGGGAGADDDLFFDGISLVDPAAGACQKYHPTDGTNIIIITYDLRLDPTVNPGQILINDARVNNYAGAEGGPNHVPDPTQRPSDNATVQIIPGATKSFVSSSEAHTSDVSAPPQVAIGELVRFRLAARVPEGASPNLQFRDLLPDGLTFIDDNTARVAFVSNGGISSSTLGGAGLNVTGTSATLAALPSAGITLVLPDNAVSSSATVDDDTYATGSDVYFSLGNVTNNDNDNDEEFVVVEFNALVDNSAAGSNDAGEDRSNAFEFWSGGNPVIVTPPNPVTSNNTTVRIAEPSLSVSKIVQSPGDALGDSGDPITYRVTITNATGANVSNAFNVNLRDVLPAELTLVNLTSITPVLSGGATGVSNNSAGNTLDIMIDNIPPGGSVQVDYTATINSGVTPGQVINNTANVTYTSLPGPNGTTLNPTGSATPGASGSDTGERDGSGTPGHNDYRISDPASVTVFTPAPVKSFITSSEPHTSDAASPPQVAVGEIVRYRLAVRLAESTAPNFQLLDAIPPGLFFHNDSTAKVAFVSNGAGITSSTLNNGLPGCANLNVNGAAADATLLSSSITCPLPFSAISGGLDTDVDVTLSLGDLTNNDTDSDNEYVVVEFNALVDNTGVGSNDAGDNLDNSFTVFINGAQSGSPSNSVQTRVVEPNVAITKIINGASASDAGDTMAYRLTLTNTGANASTAYDLVITDNLDNDLTITGTSENFAPAPSGGDPTPQTVSRSGNVWNVSRLDVGQTLTIDITVRVNATASAREIIENDAFVTYTSLPGDNGTTNGAPGNATGSSNSGIPGSNTGERTGSLTPAHNDHRATSATVSTTLATPTITKLALSDTTYTIGEPVSFWLHITLPEGRTDNLSITDQLPLGLTPTGYEIITSGSTSGTSTPVTVNYNGSGITAGSTTITGASDGQDVTFNLGAGPFVTTDDNVTTNNSFLIRVDTLVSNTAAANSGASLTNTAQLNYRQPAISRTSDPTTGTPRNTVNSRSITVVEPNLSISKTLVTPGSDGGDAVQYNITVTNVAGANVSDAYDINIVDTLPANLTPINVSSATAFTNNNPGFGGNLIDLTLASLAPGTSATFTVDATVANSAPAGATIGNSASVTWTSLPGANPNERTGAGGINDNSASATASNFTLATPVIDKQNPTPANATIGEQVSYDIRITLPEGVSQGLLVNDIVPPGLSYQGYTLDTAGYAGGSVPAPTVTPPVLASGDDITFTFGNLTNTPNGNGSDNSFVVRVRFIVANEAGNQGEGPTTLQNAATLTYTNATSGTPTNVNDSTIPGLVTVREPVLTISKDASPTLARPSADLVMYVLRINNTSTTTAYDLELIDALPAGLSYEAGSFVVFSGGGTTDDSAAPTLRWSIASLAGGASAELQYTARVNAGANADITNSATTTWTSLPGNDPNERTSSGGVNDYSTSDTATVTPAAALGDYVWRDSDANGRQDGSEQGIDGVTVSLYNGATLVSSVLTGDDPNTAGTQHGYYHFDGLLPGTTYQVRLDNAADFGIGGPLNGLILTRRDNAGDDTLDSDGQISGGNPVIVSAPTAGPGSDTPTYDFGFVQPAALGDFVWLDQDGNGRQDGGEPGIDGVTLNLYEGVVLVGTAVTGDDPNTPGTQHGYYRFDNLFPNTTYRIVLNNPADYSGGGPLATVQLTDSEATGTTTANDSDANEDGGFPEIVEAITGGEGTYTSTYDVGFYTPIALGNLVWRDRNNNGQVDGGEPVLPNVDVDLYLDNGDGLFDPVLDSYFDMQTTNGSGLYQFTDLPPGRYFVQIPQVNLDSGGTLEGYTNSDGQFTGDANNDHDHGVPVNGEGVVSELITLSSGGEPDTAADGDDTNANQTIDFGFFAAADRVALGNRVWLDMGAGTNTNNGRFDADEFGVMGVAVELYRQGQVPGTDTPVATTTTGANGYYVFDNLAPGRYVVHLPASNFAGGAVLEGYSSSTGAGSDETTNETGDENGGDALVAGGISSQVYDLHPDSEQTGEPQPNYSGPLDDDNVNFTADFSFVHAQRVALGNRVWLDTGFNGGTADNGRFDGGEFGVAGVAVQLYAAGQTPGIDTPVATTTTGANGYYVFDNLAPASYVVHLPASNFAGGAVLEGYSSSTGAGSDETTNETGDENGGDALVAGGVSSQLYDLRPDSEQTGEPQPNYTGTLDDDNVNFTADFAFFNSERVALGNRVWLDMGAGTNTNNGRFDADEFGVAGVTVQLYAAGQTPGTDTPVATTTTGANGYYVFDNLPPGRYVVHLPASNFAGGAVLEGYNSSTGAGSDETTNETGDENGGDALVAGGISSQVYDLRPDSEQTGEPQPNYAGTLDDDNVNFTADFSFVDAERVALGNRVWLDMGAGTNTNNGRFDADEFGVAGVSVQLYAAGQTPGTDTPVATTTTGANGYYVFDNLAPGRYVVHLPASNFAGGAVLEGYSSSTGAGSDETTNETGDENGGDALVAGSISSQVYDLRPDSEQTGEPQPNYTGTLDDDNVNFTADFGVVHPQRVALGNRVWLDTGFNGGTADNGQLDGGEYSVAGVSVQLYAAGQTPGTDTPVATTTTGANGYYVFDNLAPASYVVHLSANNFVSGAVLEGYRSSTGAGTDETTDEDSDENGGDALVAGGVSSQLYDLRPDSEQTGEPQPNYSGTLDDDNVNFTADFGFAPIDLVAIGNVVWLDMGAGANTNNGRFDADEFGVAGVTVELYRQSQVPGTDTPMATTTTAVNGYYVFDNLPPGRYVVHLPASNFAGGAVLEGYNSSTGAGTDETTNENGDENGGDALVAGGISSQLYNLRPDSEQTGEPQPNYTGTLDDDNVNFTADFAFFNSERVALGNRVWFDIGLSSAYDNGRLDSGETAVLNATVELYAEGQTPGTDTPLATTTTDTNGYYVFDNLAPGRYFVHLPASNFAISAALEGYRSSTGAGTDETTNENGDENGGDALVAGGISSQLYNLRPNSEQTGEPQPNYAGTLDDDNVNFTADFAFVRDVPRYALGNRVWFDTNDDGVVSGGELGVDGVTVELYSADGAGEPSGAALLTATTANGGYYRFDNLPAGDYVVVIPASNFAPSGRLEGYWSSGTSRDAAGALGETTPLDPDTVPSSATSEPDSDDNGALRANGPFSGAVLAQAVTLGPTEPDDEADRSPSDPVEPNTRSNLTVDFGFYTLSLGNIVWEDRNNDGLQQLDEPRIGGVTLELIAGDANGPVLATTTTAADGSYRFSGLTAGNYLVRVPESELHGLGILAGYISSTGDGTTETNLSGPYDGPAHDPNDALGNDDNGGMTGTPGASGVVVLTPAMTLTPGDSRPQVTVDNATGSTSNQTLGLGFWVAPALSEGDLYSLGNMVWEDGNNNGVRDGGENGINGVTVLLYADDDGNGQPDDRNGNSTIDAADALATQTTDNTGKYLFTGLEEGQYIVEVLPPAGYVGSTGRNGSASGPYEPGIAESAAAADDSRDHGTAQGTGTQAPVRSGTIRLSFRGEPQAEPDAAPPSGLRDTAQDSNGQLTIDFGLFAQARLGSLVWLDSNRDGVSNGGEQGVAGVIVTLYDQAGNVVATTTTGVDGSYSFDFLTPGSYQVGFSNLPSELTFTAQDSTNGDDTNDSDVNSTTGRTSLIVLTAGQNNLTLFAGLVRITPTSITLISFTATRTDQGLDLRWTTGTELDSFGFRLYRSATGNRADAELVTSTPIPAQGRGGSGASYSWPDSSAQPDTAYTYWLEETETDGTTHEYGPATAVNANVLGQNVVLVPLVSR